jgi:hypothetical protein
MVGDNMKLRPNRAHKLDLDNDTCYMRELEMTLDLGATEQSLVLQFFKDFQLYGLKEALMFLKNYEERQEVKEGTYAKARVITDKMFQADAKHEHECGANEPIDTEAKVLPW